MCMLKKVRSGKNLTYEKKKASKVSIIEFQ